jgi:hypothetical protein
MVFGLGFGFLVEILVLMKLMWRLNFSKMGGDEVLRSINDFMNNGSALDTNVMQVHGLSG